MDRASTQQMTRQKWSTKVSVPTLSDSGNDNDTETELNDDDDDGKDENDDDGSGDQKQFSDKAVFFISMVPLQLVTKDSVVWQNETSSSVNFCRT